MKIDFKKFYKFRTIEDYLAFLKDAEEQGCLWNSGSKPTKFSPLDLGTIDNFAISFWGGLKRNMLYGVYGTDDKNYKKAEFYKKSTEFNLEDCMVKIPNAKRLLFIEKESIDKIVGDLSDIPDCITIVYKKGHKPEFVELVK